MDRQAYLDGYLHKEAGAGKILKSLLSKVIGGVAKAKPKLSKTLAQASKEYKPIRNMLSKTPPKPPVKSSYMENVSGPAGYGSPEAAKKAFTQAEARGQAAVDKGLPPPPVLQNLGRVNNKVPITEKAMPIHRGGQYLPRSQSVEINPLNKFSFNPLKKFKGNPKTRDEILTHELGHVSQTMPDEVLGRTLDKASPKYQYRLDPAEVEVSAMPIVHAASRAGKPIQNVADATKLVDGLLPPNALKIIKGGRPALTSGVDDILKPLAGHGEIKTMQSTMSELANEAAKGNKESLTHLQSIYKQITEALPYLFGTVTAGSSILKGRE